MPGPLPRYPFDGFEAAACRTANPDLFFSGDGEPAADRDARERRAVAICRTCVAEDACLEWALARGERNGVWGGTTEDQRRPMIAARRVRERVGA